MQIIVLILEKYKPDDYLSSLSSSNLAAALIDSHRNRNVKGNLHKKKGLCFNFIILEILYLNII